LKAYVQSQKVSPARGPNKAYKVPLIYKKQKLKLDKIPKYNKLSK
jgi:hypothetical protein